MDSFSDKVLPEEYVARCTELFELLTKSKQWYKFKISEDMWGHLYISSTTYLGSLATSIARTIERQPTLISLLSNGKLQSSDEFTTHSFAVMLGCFLYAKTRTVGDKKANEDARKTMAHNIQLLYKSYSESYMDRSGEVYCLRRIAEPIMDRAEYDALISGK